MICWVCNKNEANSREHIIKRSDIKRVYGGGSYRGDHAPVHVKNGVTNNIQGSDSKLVKYNQSLCSECNGNFTQPFDLAYEKFIEYIFDNEELILHKRFVDFIDVYSSEFEVGQRNLYKYFAKSFGCRLVNANAAVPDDVRELLGKDSFETGLKINFSINEDVLILPPEDRNGFIGKGGMLAWVDKEDNSKINGYEWNEHVSWLTISYWYNTYPDGNQGSVWVADNQFIYLGSVHPLDEEQREYAHKKVKEKPNKEN